MPIPRHDIHVCLVSEQATPNFIPILDSRFRPSEVVLVVSPEMKQRAQWLKEALASRVEEVSEIEVKDAWDVKGISNALLDLLAGREGKDIALNATGGTKLMAIAAQDVFSVEKRPVFYVHPAKNQVLPLFSGGSAFAIEERVGMKDYLAIHGFRERERDLTEYPERYYLLAAEFVKEVKRFGSPLRKLNWLVGRAEGTLRVMLERNANDQFLAEQEVARNLKVESAGRARNELDAAFLAHNRLFLIECKTKALAGQEDDGPGTESLYKLDSLTALGGLNTRGMLASYQPLKNWDRQRAKDLRIQIVEVGELRDLDRHLREWVSPS